MLEHFERDYASALSDRANLLMREHGVPCTPVNFALWFNYVRSSPAALRQAMDGLISGGSGLDGEICNDLFLEHIAPAIPSRLGEQLPEHLNALMANAKRYVTEAIVENRDHIRKIGEVAEKAEQGVDPVLLVQSLMDQLSNAAMHAAKLEKNLDDTSRELDSIRQSLKIAEERASTDMLTGLANRQAVEANLNASLDSATKSGDSISLMMLDVDHFKRFNDEFGHGVGDQILRLLASVLREQLRQNDFPGRYGGEELIAILPGATLKVCEAVAERVRRSIAECRIKRRSTGETLPNVTVSIGVAQWRRDETPDALVERCDKALYLAKRIGRNRVVSELRLEGQQVA